MEREQYEAIQMGDVIVRIGDSCVGWTQGKRYKVVGWGLDMLHVLDDDGDERPVGRMGFSGGDWALYNVEVVKPGKAYEDLEVGDVLTYMPKGEVSSSLTKGKDYVIKDISLDGLMYIQTDKGNTAAVAPSSYGSGRWILQNGSGKLECKNMLPEDYLSLVDLALETRDKEWYDDLMKKAKFPV